MGKTRAGRGAAKRPGDAYLKRAEVELRKQRRSRYGGQRPILVKIPQVTWADEPPAQIPVAPPPAFTGPVRDKPPGVWPSSQPPTQATPFLSQEPPGFLESSGGPSLDQPRYPAAPPPNYPRITPPGYVAIPSHDFDGGTYPNDQGPGPSPAEPICPLVGNMCLGPGCLWFEPIHQCSMLAITQTLYSVLADLRRLVDRG